MPHSAVRLLPERAYPTKQYPEDIVSDRPAYFPLPASQANSILPVPEHFLSALPGAAVIHPGTFTVTFLHF